MKKIVVLMALMTFAVMVMPHGTSKLSKAGYGICDSSPGCNCHYESTFDLSTIIADDPGNVQVAVAENVRNYTSIEAPIVEKEVTYHFQSVAAEGDIQNRSLLCLKHNRLRNKK